MTTDEQLTAIVDSWLASTNASPHTAEETVDHVAARLPQTRQRSRWWRLPSLRRTTTHLSDKPSTDYQPTPIQATNGHSATITGRTQFMFSPAKAITAAALVFALGGVLLIAQPFDQQGGSVPGAAAGELIPPVEVTGTSESPAGCTDTDYEGSFEDIGADAWLWSCSTEAGMPWSFTDPRLEGVVTRTNVDYRIDLGDGSDVYIASSAFSIENDGGTWRERPRTWFFPDGYLTFDFLTDEVVVLDGTGEYEGLVAVLRATGVQTTGPLSEFRGFIIDARWMPPAPENASTR